MEILFDSPILLIVVIGFLSSLYKRIKGTDENSRRPRPASKASPASPQAPQPAMPSGGSGSTANIQQLYQERRSQVENAQGNRRQREPGRGGRLSASNIPSSSSEPVAAEPKLHLKPDRDSLIEGVIWSEILGEPRSKKPYRPAGRN